MWKEWSSRYPRLTAIGGVLVFIATALATIQGIWNLFSNEPLFPYISDNIPLWPRILLLCIFIGIAIFCVVLIIVVFRYIRKIPKSNPQKIIPKSESLTDTLTVMYRRLVELKKEKASHTKIGYKKIENVIPTLANRLGTVESKDWPKFSRDVKRRIIKASPKRPYLRRKFRSSDWVKYKQEVQFAALSVASQIKKVLLGSKEWTLEDAIAASEWLDSYHWGIKEIRDNDPQWKSLFESISHYFKDETLRNLIQKHIDISYVYCNVSLIVYYSETTQKTSFSSMLHETLVGSPISSEKAEVALGEILHDIEIRLGEIESEQKERLLYKADVILDGNILFLNIINNGDIAEFSSKGQLISNSDYTIDSSWKRPYDVLWEDTNIIPKGLTGRIKIASLEPTDIFPGNYIRLYRLSRMEPEYKDSNTVYIWGSVGAVVTQYKFDILVSSNPNPANAILEVYIVIDLKGNLDWSQTTKSL
jgi:hypothetical protein